jgi:hypothetical protein
MRILITFITSALLGITVWGAEEKKCSRVTAFKNLEKSLPDHNAKMISDQRALLGSIRDQDSIGWCYAFAGADLYEHWLKKRGSITQDQTPNNIISPIAFSLNYHSKDWKRLNKRFRNLAVNRRTLLPKKKKTLRRLDTLTDSRMKRGKNAINIFNNYFKQHPKINQLRQLQAQMTSQEDPTSRERVQDAIYELEEQIEDDIYNSNLFKNAIKQNNAAKQQLDIEIKEARKEIEKINQKLITKDDMIPEGGFIKSALLSMWPQICFESEISSRDSSFYQIYSDYRDLIAEIAFPPINLQGAFGHLSLLPLEYKNAEKAEQCLGLELSYNPKWCLES